jgi:hypothetical protein
MKITLLNIILLVLDTIGRILTNIPHVSKKVYQTENHYYRIIGWLLILGADITMTVFSTFDPLFMWMVNCSFLIKDLLIFNYTHIVREAGARY